MSMRPKQIIDEALEQYADDHNALCLEGWASVNLTVKVEAPEDILPHQLAFQLETIAAELKRMAYIEQGRELGPRKLDGRPLGAVEDVTC